MKLCSYDKMDEGEHYVKWNHLDTNTAYFFSYVEAKEVDSKVAEDRIVITRDHKAGDRREIEEIQVADI